jgi:hypothetical protein
MLAAGNKEKAIILLEEDNHPISTLLSFMLSLSIKEPNELKNAYEYAREEMRRRLTGGTSMLAWLTLIIPIISFALWYVIPLKTSHVLNSILLWTVIAEVLLWNSILFYIKFKVMSILSRADDHFTFFSGLFMIKKKKEVEVNIEGLVDETKDVVDITAGLKAERGTTKKVLRKE